MSEMEDWDDIEEYYDVRHAVVGAYVRNEDDYILVHEEEMPFFASPPVASPVIKKNHPVEFGSLDFWQFLGRAGHPQNWRKSHGHSWKAGKEDDHDLEKGRLLHQHSFVRRKTVIQHNPLQSLSAFFVFVVITFLLQFVYLKSLDVMTMAAEIFTGVQPQELNNVTHSVASTYATLSVFATWYAIFLVVREVLQDWIVAASNAQSKL